MALNIIISRPKKLEKAKRLISKAGVEKLHILSDFDRTLTKAFANGEAVPSIISILRDGNYLTPDYAKKAHDLYNKYRPFENNPKISKRERKRMMKEWWMSHFQLLIKSKLNKKDVEKIIESEKIKFRDGLSEFIGFLKDRDIPLVIISSAGFGEESISSKLKKEGKFYNNIYIVSNSFKWDQNGNAISVRLPIIHGANKDETLIKNFPKIFGAIKNRRNVILLGDSVDDVGMVEGFEYGNLIKIGFLNENIEGNLESYKRNFDVVILNDSSMDYVNELLREIK